MSYYGFSDKDGEYSEFVYLGGGVDVNPRLYSQEVHPETQFPDHLRDELGFALITEALFQNKPIIGVCRGHQLLNVYNGGTLHQHIGPISGDIFLSHTPIGNVTVVSDHHQAVDIVGNGAEVIHLFDNMPYIIHWPNIRAMSFQFHPEWNNGGADLANYYIEKYLKIKGIF